MRGAGTQLPNATRRSILNTIRAGTLLNAPNHHPKHLRLNVSNSPPHAPSTYPAGVPAGFTAAYPALCFWLPTPG